MFKKILVILLSSFIGIMAGPEILSASNSVAVTGINNDGIVETVIPEPEPKPEPAPVTTYVTYTQPVYVPQVQNYTVTQYTANFVESPSYYDIYKTNKLIYAHNSANLMGNLVNLGVGSVFTITEGGIARSYRVNDRKIFVLDDTRVYLTDTANGMTSTMKGNIISGANGHQVALMTCYGAYDAAIGTARYRLFIYADAI